MKCLAILGCTGSIGESTLQVVRHLGPDFVTIGALAAHSNIELLEKQALEFSPELIAVYDKEKALLLQKRLPKFKVLGGMEGIKAVASYPSVNFVVSAMAGTAGLVPTLAAITAGKNIGLANKESLVSGGSLVMSLVRQHQVSMVPIDSEHSAIFQCFNGEKKENVRRIILTASGGPFYKMSKQELATVNLEQALRHPKWSMGPKITIDCSTLMNKGLELIEAHWLFDVPLDKIEVLIHPQSIIHSLVEYIDGSMMAQMSEPSMLIPIQYALTYPERKVGFVKPFDFLRNNQLNFFQPDLDNFRCLYLAHQAIKEGGSLPCYMNAANEILVKRFIQKEIAWAEIAFKLETLMSSHQIAKINSLEDIFAIDSDARKEAFLV
jgi:1-deoxy-D-xylulose-5-phosphate reductoisomerase